MEKAGRRRKRRTSETPQPGAARATPTLAWVCPVPSDPTAPILQTMPQRLGDRRPLLMVTQSAPMGTRACLHLPQTALPIRGRRWPLPPPSGRGGPGWEEKVAPAPWVSPGVGPWAGPPLGLGRRAALAAAPGEDAVGSGAAWGQGPRGAGAASPSIMCFLERPLSVSALKNRPQRV